MTAFIVYKRNKYLVKNVLCIGKECLVLGERGIEKPMLDFSKNKELITQCCTRMVDEGCPSEQEFPFLKSVRDSRIKNRYGIRTI